MGEIVKIRQKEQHAQCCCAPPCACLTYPNEYFMERGGAPFLAIKEDNNCVCQKVCLPACRAYDSEIRVKEGGLMYRVKRPLACG